MRKFLIWASTADPAILRQCPGERIRYEAMGAAILTTATIACVSATFAVSMALHLWLPFAVVVGLGWGLAILNIDRLLVGGVHRRETTWGNVATALPRLVLALLIGAVVSTPLVLRIFDSEINAQLDVDHQTALVAFTDKINTDPRFVEIPALTKKVQDLQQVAENGPADSADKDPTVARLQSEYDQLNTQYQQAEHDVICENEGTCGSNKVGRGPAYDEKVKNRDHLLQSLNAKKTELDNARAAVQAKQSSQGAQVQTDAAGDLKADKAKLDALNQERQGELDKYTEKAKDDRGLLARIEALDHLRSGNASLGTAYLALLALLAALEMLPVIAKLMMSLGRPSVYEQIRNDSEMAEYLIASSNSAQRAQTAMDEAMARVDAERHQVVAQAQHISDAQLEVFDAVLDRWKQRELDQVARDADSYLAPSAQQALPAHPVANGVVFVPQHSAP